MQSYSIPSVEDIPFDASPVIRALLAEVLDRLATLEEENQGLKEEVSALREENALERAYDRQRLARLEAPAPAPALREETAAAHLDRLFSEMRRLRMRQTNVRDAARFIGISKPHMQKLKPYLAADMRFTLLKDPNRPNRYLIRIV